MLQHGKCSPNICIYGHFEILQWLHELYHYYTILITHILAATSFYLDKTAVGELYHNQVIEWEEQLPFNNPPVYSTEQLERAAQYTEKLGHAEVSTSCSGSAAIS